MKITIQRGIFNIQQIYGRSLTTLIYKGICGECRHEN